MNNLYYPRALNRPTYIFWRYTFTDIKNAAMLSLGLLLPAAIWDNWPKEYIFLATVAWLLYRGAVVALKPRGWDRHVVQSWFQAVILDVGHTYHRLFVLTEVEIHATWFERTRNHIKGLFADPTG